MDIVKPQVKRTELTYRKMKDINQEAFQEDLNTLVKELSQITDHEKLMSDYNKLLQNTLDKHAPLLKKRVTHRERVPWFTETATILKRKKRQVEKLTKNGH